MALFDKIVPGTLLRGVIPGESVKVIQVDWVDGQSFNLVYRKQDGGVSENTFWLEDEPNLEIEQQECGWTFDGDGALLRLVAEAHRLRLAFHFDPYLAVHSSQVDPLPHQISAVYEEMLPRQPLRFLLADDPGAGKTIMAGLLIKELIARADLERCLIVVPGSLVEQWQDELGEKFSMQFEILTRSMIGASRSGNPFEDQDYLIARLDMLARDTTLQEKLERATEWDMVVCDEAHRMAATWSGGEVSYTKRYRVGQLLGQQCRHFLLMSATPHNGKESDFQLFMALLDGDRFEGLFRDGDHFADTNDLMRRLTKEELLRFDGRPLFPERYAYTVKYELTSQEAALYDAVTTYVREEMNRVQRFTNQDGRKRNTVGFALQILQRRLASSPAAIYESLKRRRERLENELDGRWTEVEWLEMQDGDSWDTIYDDHRRDEIEEEEERILTGSTAALTAEQLTIEIKTLKNLEHQALSVLHSGQDTKWSQLDRILDDPLMVDSTGTRRKLIVFTEPKDTLNYLVQKIQGRLGSPHAVEAIHGRVSRDERRRIVERFMTDRNLLVLVANDAAGEGVNLQRGHLMVNYDLPWNPNRIEQRFGRIHRIGQTEVCHLWNLVAKDTQEGAVYARLLEKLEVAREALGGRVYDVLGELFEQTPLRDLLFEAIQYGEQEDVKSRLFKKVDNAADKCHLLELLNRRALTNDSLSVAVVEKQRRMMEVAEAQRLQPCHVQGFFVKAFRHLGGQITQREKGRWEITHVPANIREHNRKKGVGSMIQRRYERICFEKGGVYPQPVATFLSPGHPLLEAVIEIILHKHGHLMRRGAVLVDDVNPDADLSVLVLLAHSVQDARTTRTGKPHIISEKLQFAVIHQDGQISSGGIAPHLNLRPLQTEEAELLKETLDDAGFDEDFERRATGYAIAKLARQHVREVRERRLPQIEKVEQEVKDRLRREINHWEKRAMELNEQERVGQITRLSSHNAKQRVGSLEGREKRRMELLEKEKFISSLPPRVLGGMLVVPRQILEELSRKHDGDITTSRVDPDARNRSEQVAMEAVMNLERKLGYEPEDISHQKIGYDIRSYDPKAGKSRFIEVKGRVGGANTVMITKQEFVVSRHEPGKFILALVEVNDGCADMPRYVPGPLGDHDPPFELVASQFDIRKLLERAVEVD